MNRFKRMTSPLIWFITLLIVAFVAGCLGGGGDTASSAPNVANLSSAKSVTTFSLGGYTGVVNESAKTIAVTVPFGTPVTGLVATFTISGVGVTVGAINQKSGTTPNNFTSPMTYIVLAADGTISTYTVTVTLATLASSICGGNSGTNCVNLGTSANYAVLDEATVTFTPIATNITIPTITGNVGVSPNAASFITGFALAMDPALCFAKSTHVTGNIFAADYSTSSGCATTPDTTTILTTAISDKNAAYSAALLKVPAGGGLATACPGTGAFDGAVVAPLVAGVYTCGAGVTIPTNFTLNGNSTDVWVFQITGALSQTGATSILLTGGALPKNVFWVVSNGVTIGSTAHMEGVVLSATNISLVNGASVKGRLLARTGVLMDTNTVTQP